MIKFKSFCSGSAGNCYFLGLTNDQGKVETGILIDAGVSYRRVKKELAQDGIAIELVKAIIITHDHFDHIRSLGSYCKYLRVPVYSTRKIIGALCRHSVTSAQIGPCKRVITEDQWEEIIPSRLKVLGFEVPHDATQTIGLAVLADAHKYVHITDCGSVTPSVISWCSQAQTLVLESNYDVQMLREGHYPPELQQRIRGGHGHISNDECASALQRIMHPELKNIFLCHLSENNNTPQKADQASRAVIPQGVRLQALPRLSPSALFILD